MFHWKDGWFFERASGSGDVHVTKRREAKLEAEIQASAVIPASEWASIVASVSGHGETAERYHEALHFHME